MKVREVYDRALAMINERDSGGAYHSDTADFEKNTPSILNSFIILLLSDDAMIRGNSVRDISYGVEPMASMEDEIPLHNALASGVLPFALASFLLLEEDKERADYFYRLYLEAKSRVVSAFATARHRRIKNMY